MKSAGKNKKPKKMILKPFRPPAAVQDDFAEKTLSEICGAIDAIYARDASQLSFEVLYRNAYNLVVHKYGDLLYAGVKATIKEHLLRVSSLLSDAVDDSDALLDAVIAAWKDQQRAQGMVADILMYMDRMYVPSRHLLTVGKLGTALFRDVVATQETVKMRLRAAFLNCVSRDRLGLTVEGRLRVKEISDMFAECRLHETEVMEPYLEQCQLFYAAEARDLLEGPNSIGIDAYVEYAADKVEKEKERATVMCGEDTGRAARNVCLDKLVGEQKEVLVGNSRSGLVALWRAGRMEALKRLYGLLEDVKEGHDEMMKHLTEDVFERGMVIVGKTKEGDDDSKKKADRLGEEVAAVIEPLYALRAECAELVEGAFKNDIRFARAVNTVFEKFVNTSERMPELLALHVDKLLRTGVRGMTEAEVETALDSFMSLFRYLAEKDVLEKFYKTHLARRLIHRRSASDDAERALLAKLRRECGHHFTHKLEGMFKDMGISSQLDEEFSQKQRDLPVDSNSRKSDVDMSVVVLNAGYWPVPRVPDSELKLRLPLSVDRVADAYKTFYLAKHQGRRLEYHWSMGTAEIRGKFGSKRHELTVSTHQMVLLELFNAADSYSVGDLARLGGLSEADAVRSLLPIVSSKYRLLTVKLKNPSASPTSPDKKSVLLTKLDAADILTFNSKFRAKTHRLRIPASIGGAAAAPSKSSAPSSSAESDRAAAAAEVHQDRTHQIDACLVRVLKSRRRIAHTECLSEVTRLLSSRFRAQPTDIKKRIESLIEREYIQRADDDNSFYTYLA